jgi:hypothetical protein
MVAAGLDRERLRDSGGVPELGAEGVVSQLLHAEVGVVDQHHVARTELALRDR